VGADVGGDFSFGIRAGAIDAAASASGAGADAHRHFPYARRLLLDWHHDQGGPWISGGEDQRRWEVFCAECGDTDGPADTQTEPVRRLRGPYPSERKARHAAQKHFDEN
jgi:hypothetical protein